MELITIAGYSTNAHEHLFEFVIGHPETWSEPLESISQHRTIRALLSHCLGAEQRWIARIKDAPQPERYESACPVSVVNIHKDFRRQRDETLAIINAADRAEMERRIDVSIPQINWADTLTVEEILFHIFNHESYHRAQVSMLLQHQAIDPPNFDYTFLKA
jgi:uncharacterized damage-inducible protein DinB